MGYKQNNPLPMMKSAMKMMKAERKSGMHRDSAMYMNSPMYKGHSPMEMGHSPMEMGHDSPAKNMNKGYGQEVKSPMKRESAELKDMPIVDIEKVMLKVMVEKMLKKSNLKLKENMVLQQKLLNQTILILMVMATKKNL